MPIKRLWWQLKSNPFPEYFWAKDFLCLEKINIQSNGSWLIIGLIKVLDLPSNYMSKDKDNNIGSIGLNTYYEIKKICELEYVRVNKDSNS